MDTVVIFPHNLMYLCFIYYIRFVSFSQLFYVMGLEISEGVPSNSQGRKERKEIQEKYLVPECPNTMKNW